MSVAPVKHEPLSLPVWRAVYSLTCQPFVIATRVRQDGEQWRNEKTREIYKWNGVLGPVSDSTPSPIRFSSLLMPRQMPITPHQTRHALKPPRNSFYLLLPPEKSRCCLNLWCLFKCLQMQAELWLPMKISFTANLPPFLLSYIFYAWMYASLQELRGWERPGQKRWKWRRNKQFLTAWKHTDCTQWDEYAHNRHEPQKNPSLLKYCGSLTWDSV